MPNIDGGSFSSFPTAAIRWHAQDPALFQEAIAFTAAQTGFLERFIEELTPTTDSRPSRE